MKFDWKRASYRAKGVWCRPFKCVEQIVTIYAVAHYMPPNGRPHAPEARIGSKHRLASNPPSPVG